MNITYEPLTPEHLSEIDSPEPNGYWEMEYVGVCNEISTAEMDVRIVYNLQPDSLYASTLLSDDSSFYYDFPSSQPFLDIVDYIREHPDVFFDHSEFNDENYLSVYSMDSDKYLRFSLNSYYIRGRGRYYCIVKITEDPPVPEIEHVFEMIETSIIEELLKHPWDENPQ